MIPALLFMLAIYGTCRLAIEVCRAYPNDVGAKRVTWLFAIFGFLALWFVAVTGSLMGFGIDPSKLR